MMSTWQAMLKNTLSNNVSFVGVFCTSSLQKAAMKVLCSPKAHSSSGVHKSCVILNALGLLGHVQGTVAQP